MHHDLQGAILTQLAQARPSNTATASLYTLTAKKIVWITSLLVANTTSSDATYSIFYDADGTTYDENTAIAYGVTLPAHSFDLLEFENPIPLIVSGGSIGIQSGTSSAITYTMSGYLRDVR